MPQCRAGAAHRDGLGVRGHCGGGRSVLGASVGNVHTRRGHGIARLPHDGHPGALAGCVPGGQPSETRGHGADRSRAAGGVALREQGPGAVRPHCHGRVGALHEPCLAVDRMRDLRPVRNCGPCGTGRHEDDENGGNERAPDHDVPPRTAPTDAPIVPEPATVSPSGESRSACACTHAWHRLPDHASPCDKRVQPGGPHWGTRPRPLPPRLPAPAPPPGGCVDTCGLHGHSLDHTRIRSSIS